MAYKVNFTMLQLLEAGVHIGHKKNLWHPKMSSYIYGIRNKIHIIDLQKTKVLLNRSLNILRDIALNNGKVLFVGTKKQALDVVAENASRCGQYYVNYRWLGGMLTNWSTVSSSIKTLQGYEEILNDENSILTKKEKLNLLRKKEKLDKVLGGIRNMGGLPTILFVVDAKEHALAIKEANKLNIPVIAVVDTNTDPEGVDYIIPGNDDARKATDLYCHLAANAILSGMQESLETSGVDVAKLEEKKKNADKGIKDLEAKKEKEDNKIEDKKEQKKAAPKAKASTKKLVEEEKKDNKEEKVVKKATVAKKEKKESEDKKKKVVAKEASKVKKVKDETKEVIKVEDKKNKVTKKSTTTTKAAEKKSEAKEKKVVKKVEKKDKIKE